MQPQMAVALALAQGTSTVTENLFENRFKYVDELAKMGANIKVESNIAVFEGIDEFTGAEVNALDLRAGAALVIAGIAAKGFTTIESVHYIKRGYEMLEKKLQKLGAQIELTSSDKDIQKFKLKVG